jgi:asparagine synthase (glutamine-hydrolysing)
MCGICGEVGTRRFVTDDDKVVRRMADSLRHRGPDDEGFYIEYDGDVGANLGSRRLAIIDRQRGKQPMGQSCAVVYNGEIYNHELMRTKMPVETFRTHCDTEVVAKAYENLGPMWVHDAVGMFAVAIWDIDKRQLYLVRDRIGKKPLYYYHDWRGVLVFASEIKAILQHPLYTPRPNTEGLYHYLCLQFVPEPMTAFEDIKAVPPGCILQYDPLKDDMTMLRYWRAPVNMLLDENPQAMARTVRDTVSQAIADRLESEVPLGVYLSGGVDSSIVAAVAKEAAGEVHTFSMGFEEAEFNELSHAREVAEFLGTVHHEETVRVPALPEITERIVQQYDQPFGDQSAIPTMLLAEASKKHITVALTGDGGDEAFGGYPRYWMAPVEKGVPGYWPWLCVFQPPIRDYLIQPGWFGDKPMKNTYSVLMQAIADYNGDDAQNGMMYLDMQTYLINDIIVKMERATMAYSVEARCPFLDHRVLELGVLIPSHHKIRNQAGKMVLKDAFAADLPDHVLHRKKQGFGVPMNHWLRTQTGKHMLMRHLLDRPFCGGMLQRERLAQAVKNQILGVENLGHGLWMLMTLSMWWQQHFERAGA